MAKSPSNRSRSRGKNNNPEGRNQYTSGWMGMARERPATAAAVAAGTVAAGVFLWSKRAQISDQLNQLSDQIGEWTENLNSGSERELEMAQDDAGFGSATGTTGEFAGTGSVATGNRGATAKRSRTRESGSRSAVGGNGTMSGSSLDTSPSGSGRA
jgi:hypothetical protein